MFGVYLAFGVVLGPIFAAFDFGPSATSFLGDGIVLTGVLASFGVGFLLKKYRCYKWMLIICCWGTCLSFFIVIFSLYSNNETLVVINMLFVGFFMIPIIAISLNFSSELTFPMEPTVITGVLLLFG